VVLNARDVTERWQAEAALRKSEEQNRALVNAIPDLLIQISQDGVILSYHAQDEADLYLPPARPGRRLQGKRSRSRNDP
jgi:rsbT co-antagonist protein RsbR